MKSKNAKRRISALGLSALGAAALSVTACSSAQSTSPEQTASANSAQVVAPLTCTPLLATSAPLLNCGAVSASQVSTAASIQSSIAAQMQTAFASLTLTPMMAQNQIAISSSAAAFNSLFGSTITASLVPNGFFTATVPIALGSLAPSFALQANVFGLFPTWTSTPLLNTTTLTPFLNTTTNTTFAAFNAAAMNTANSAVFNTSAVQAASMPLTFFVSTPIATSLPFTCSGMIPFGCQ